MARVTGDSSETNNNFNSANGTGLAVRGKFNEILTALRTINAGTNDPVGVANLVQFQPHINNNVLKICTGVTGTDASATGTFTTIGNITQDNLGLLPVDGTNPMTGNLQLPNGSQAAPSLNFGDTQTGLFKHSTNNIGLTANNTLVSTIHSNGITIAAGKCLYLNNAADDASVCLKAKSNLGSNVTLTMPENDGDPNQALVTDGNGVLSFATVASSGGGVVKNIVQTVKTDQEMVTVNDINTGSFVDVPDMNVSITPQATGNKFLVEFSLVVSFYPEVPVFVNLQRKIAGANDTTIALPDTPGQSANQRSTVVVAGYIPQSGSAASFSYNRQVASFKFLDAPSYTSGQAIQYRLTIGGRHASTANNRNKIGINRSHQQSTEASSSQIMVTEYDI